MVASATDALSESVHGMALALYGFLFGRRGLFWMNFGSILRDQGSQKWCLGRFGVHFEYPKASKSGLWGARGFFLDRWRLQGGL